MNKDIILNEFARVSEAMGWDSHHAPKKLATVLAVDAAKLLDNFRWLSEIESEMIDDETLMKAISADVADLYIYLTVLCHKLDVDPWSCVKDKLLVNREKHIEKLVEQQSRPQGSKTPFTASVSASVKYQSNSLAEQPLPDEDNEWKIMARRIANSREGLRAASLKLKEEKLKR